MIDLSTVREATEGKAYLRPGEVARLTGISAPHIYQEISAGRLPAVRYRSRTLMVPVDGFIDWFRDNIAPVTPEPDVTILDDLSAEAALAG